MTNDLHPRGTDNFRLTRKAVFGHAVVECSVRKHDKKLPPLFNYLYKKILRYWALPCFGNIQEVESNLKNAGFNTTKCNPLTFGVSSLYTAKK